MKAVLIVFALVLAVPFADFVVTVAKPLMSDSAAQSGLNARAIVGAGDADVALDIIEEIANPGEATLPEGFAEEVGVLPEARDVRVNEDGSVVGYLVDGDEERVFDRVSAQMESRGWSTVPLGEEGAATFVKSGGRCVWALVTCTQAGDATCVVVRSAAS